MTHTDFLNLIKHPQAVKPEQLADLKALVEQYPYFSQARMLYVKLLQQTKHIQFASQFQLASLHSPNLRGLFYYVHPEKMLSTQSYRPDKAEKSAGDYFDMMSAVETGSSDPKTTLKNLADRLKSARSLVMIDKNTPTVKKVDALPAETLNPAEKYPTPLKIEQQPQPALERPTIVDYFAHSSSEVTEIQAKKLISERKYAEAIEILKQLNLNNPKKSVYFADQIRFLEKVIVNSKK